MESRDDQRRGGGNPAPATTYIILSRSGAGYLGSYLFILVCDEARCALAFGAAQCVTLIAEIEFRVKGFSL